MAKKRFWARVMAPVLCAGILALWPVSVGAGVLAVRPVLAGDAGATGGLVGGLVDAGSLAPTGSPAPTASPAPQGAGIGTGPYLVFAISGGLMLVWVGMWVFKRRDKDE